MKTNLPARIEAIPLPDPRRPARMPSLPGWVASRVVSVTEEWQTDPKNPEATKGRSVLTLPKELLLSPLEKAAIELHCGLLRPYLAATPDNPDGLYKTPDGDLVPCVQATLTLVTQLMLALPAERTTEMAVEASGEAYNMALEDVPTWAVAEAIRVWYRGESTSINPKHPHDFRWRPVPAILRALAIREAWKVEGRIRLLERVLVAEERIECSDEHCAAMRKAIAEVFRNPVKAIPTAPVEPKPDGAHAQRVEAELAARRVRREEAPPA